MKRFFIFGLIIILSSSFLRAQYISNVIAYVPAPGQFINKSPGLPENAQSIVGGVNGLVSLGAFGGYIVCQFDSPIENHKDNPYGIDFSIFGNAYIGSSEPGIVMVMKDENNNGIPDETWFELKGSHHYLSSTLTDYSVTYKNPGMHSDVHWTDNQDHQGTVAVNDIHLQNYYPEAEYFQDIDPNQYTLSGTRLAPQTYMGLTWYNLRFDYGYADNTPKIVSGSIIEPDNPYTLETIEGGGGDAFDINWAIDSTGNHVDLDEISFIKIYNGVLQNAGAIGEVSTEIRGIIDVAPNTSLKGIEDVIVSNHPLFDALNPGSGEYLMEQYSQFQFESFVVSKGRAVNNQQLNWQSSNSNVLSVDAEGLVYANHPGNAEVVISMQNNSNIKRTFKIKVTEATHFKAAAASGVKIYPNPASEHIFIYGHSTIEFIEIYSSNGKLMLKKMPPSNKINIANFPNGLYLLKCQSGHQFFKHQFFKND